MLGYATSHNIPYVYRCDGAGFWDGRLRYPRK